MLKTICEYFFIFMIYSVGGWIMETLLYMIRDKKCVKRGFLFGPVCPIYGSGAVICSAVLYGRVSNIFLLFIFGLLLCGTLEYLTHFLMEKLFNAMWWDYSSRRFNIKGRVYLNGLLTFGAGVVIIIRVLQPMVFKLIEIMPLNLLYFLSFVIYSLLLIDISTTLADLKGTVSALRNLQEFAGEKIQKGIDVTDEKVSETLRSFKDNDRVSSGMEWLKNDNALIKRIHEKYPDFTLKKYKGVLNVVMDKPIPEKARTDIKLYGSSENNLKDDSNENKTTAQIKVKEKTERAVENTDEDTAEDTIENAV